MASLFLLVMVKKIPIGVYLQFTQLKSIDEKPLPCPVLNQQRELAGLVMFTMAVAAYGAHSGDPIDEKELSMVYMVLFAYMMHAGPGKISVDYWLFKRAEA